MELAGLPTWIWIFVAIGVTIGSTIAVGWYVSRSLTGEKGSSIASLLSTINDQMTAMRGDIGAVKGDVGAVKDDLKAVKGDVKDVRGDVERTRSELVGEMRSLDSRIREVEKGQSHTQGMLDAAAKASTSAH